MIAALCPFCQEPAERPTRFRGIFFCGRHGDFEWFDRGPMGGVDVAGLYQSYPYNLAIEEDYEVMRPKYLRGLRKRILRHFAAAAGLSFLDVGCANGEYMDCGRELGLAPVAGVEVDEPAAAKAKKFGPVFKSLQELSGSFDLIQCKNVLSNIEDFREFFSAMLRLLKPSGVLFCDVLNQKGLSARLKKMMGRPGILRPPFVINGFSKKSLAALAERSGASVISLETTYCGSDLLPYRQSFSLTWRGKISRWLGAGTMIIADIAFQKKA